MKTLRIKSLAALAISLVFYQARDAAAGQSRDWRVVGSDRMGVAVIEDGVPRFKIGAQLHGPQFIQAQITAMPAAKDGVRELRQLVSYKKGMRQNLKPDEVFTGKTDLAYTARKTGPKTLAIQFVARTDKEARFENPNGSASKGVPSIWLGPVISASDPYFAGGTCRLELVDGKTEEIALPPPRGNTPGVKAAALATASGETVRLVFDPPVTAHRDQGEVRGWLQSGPLPAGEAYTQTVTVELPRAFEFQPDNPWVKTDDWFELTFDNDFSKPGVLDINGWQDKPAGKHGWLREKDAAYVFEDGTPVKFWGDVTTIWKDDKPTLDQQAAAMAKYGINMARCVTMSHRADKWAHFIPLSDPQDGLKFDPANLDRYDYAMAKFKENGIYTYISPFYDYHLTPGDRTRLANYDEMEAMQLKDGLFAHSTYTLSVVCPDLQDVIIQWHLNLLNHTNRYTGLRYADEPAAAIWELNNEDNIFLSLMRMEPRFKLAPTYNKQVHARFAKLMLGKYGSQEGLAKAWGAELKAGESLADATVKPWPTSFEGNTKSPRAADQMWFFYKEQSGYYHKWAKAVRETGYKGVLSAGCWQASTWIGHLHNVRTDWEIGAISRHNYATADIKKPGVGLMSAGFQAVLDRTFIMSEWSGAYRVGQQTDVPLIAAYGMGLQGWDGSNHMAWGYPGLNNFQNGINATANSYNVLSQYPAMARMVRRGDVKEGEVVGNRRVSLAALDRGDVGFAERFSLLGGANNKEFVCAVPNAAMAAGRVVLEFVDGPVEQPVVDKSAPFLDRETGSVRSTTGELFWDAAGEGCFTVNTPGTKAAVGYIGGRTHDLGEVAMRTDNPYAHLYVTALGKEETIANAQALLVTTVARMVDKGTVFDAYADAPLAKPEPKKGPTLIEPVKAAFEVKGRKDAKVFALDHEGRKPDGAQPLPVEKTKDGVRFTVDGAQTKAVHYVVEFGR